MADETTETRRDWEVVQEDLNKSKTDRLRIKGGWLVRTTINDSTGEPVAVAMVFNKSDDREDRPDRPEINPTGKAGSPGGPGSAGGAGGPV